MRRTILYGKNTLPVLVARHPELEKVLKLDLLNSFLWRLTVKRLFFLPVFWMARILDSLPLPDILYDYLTFAAFASGWLEGKRK